MGEQTPIVCVITYLFMYFMNDSMNLPLSWIGSNTGKVTPDFLCHECLLVGHNGLLWNAGPLAVLKLERSMSVREPRIVDLRLRYKIAVHALPV